VNTFHQIGMALGLGVLVAAAAHAGRQLTAPGEVLTARVGTALATGSALLALCLLATLTLVVPVELAARRATGDPAGTGSGDEYQTTQTH
jgi:hypothetical protein